MASSCPLGHLEATVDRGVGEGGLGQWWGQGCRKAWREVGGDDPGSLQGSRGGHLSFHLNTLVRSLYVTFQIERHFLGSPAVTLSHSLHY